jgi:protein-S-isoprenylcysteine O-methyltransferase Ste14
MYLAMLLLYCASGLLLDTIYWLPLMPPLIGFMNWGVITREERYLEGIFGPEYVAYKARVRRWL